MADKAMGVSIRRATLADFDTIVALMRGYYRDDRLEFDPARHGTALQRLLREPQWGSVLLLESQGAYIGYVAICIGYSLELGGNDAFIDEVFVDPDHRGRGYGKQLLRAAGEEAARLGIRALHLEVDRRNDSAQRLYGSLGYERRDRYFLMTKKT